MNWIIDADFIMRGYPEADGWCPQAKVHDGFYRMYRHHEDKMTAAVIALHKRFPDYRVCMCVFTRGVWPIPYHTTCHFISYRLSSPFSTIDGLMIGKLLQTLLIAYAVVLLVPNLLHNLRIHTPSWSTPQIVFAGHSMGGALCELHAAHFYRQVNCTRTPDACTDVQRAMASVAQAMEIHTFGCPRLYNKIMSRCVSPMRRNRVVNKAGTRPSHGNHRD